MQDLHIEPSEKETHANESMMLKMFYLYEFVGWTKCIWWAIKMIVCSIIVFWILQVKNLIPSEIKQKLS